MDQVNNTNNGRVLDAALTVEEVADKLKVSPATVYSLLRAGELVSYRVGRSWRVDEADLMEYIQQKKTRGGFHSSGTNPAHEEIEETENRQPAS